MRYELLVIGAFIFTGVVYWLLMVGLMNAIDWIYEVLFRWST